MEDNLNTVLRELIFRMDKKAFTEAMPALKRLVSTPEGKELTRKIKASDRETLVKLIGEIKPDAKSGAPSIPESPEAIRRLIDVLDGRK